MQFANRRWRGGRRRSAVQCRDGPTTCVDTQTRCCILCSTSSKTATHPHGTGVAHQPQPQQRRLLLRPLPAHTAAASCPRSLLQRGRDSCCPRRSGRRCGGGGGGPHSSGPHSSCSCSGPHSGCGLVHVGGGGGEGGGGQSLVQGLTGGEGWKWGGRWRQKCVSNLLPLYFPERDTHTHTHAHTHTHTHTQFSHTSSPPTHTHPGQFLTCSPELPRRHHLHHLLLLAPWTQCLQPRGHCCSHSVSGISGSSTSDGSTSTSGSSTSGSGGSSTSAGSGSSCICRQQQLLGVWR